MFTSKREKGFTLMELLIVMAILGLLASLVGPAMLGKVDTAKTQTAKAKLRTLAMAVDTYKLDTGVYPDNLQQLISSEESGWGGPYLKKEVPKDPWKNEYVYKKDGSGYTLKSYGEDGKEGGEGNAADVES